MAYKRWDRRFVVWKVRCAVNEMMWRDGNWQVIEQGEVATGGSRQGRLCEVKRDGNIEVNQVCCDPEYEEATDRL